MKLYTTLKKYNQHSASLWTENNIHIVIRMEKMYIGMIKARQSSGSYPKSSSSITGGLQMMKNNE